AAAGRADVLADPADGGLGLHHRLPRRRAEQRRQRGGRRAARRRAAVGGGAAQPDGLLALLPRGDLVTQSRPSLRLAAAAAGDDRGADGDERDPRADRRAAGDGAGLGALRLRRLAHGAGGGGLLRRAAGDGLGGGAGGDLADPAFRRGGGG